MLNAKQKCLSHKVCTYSRHNTLCLPTSRRIYIYIYRIVAVDFFFFFAGNKKGGNCYDEHKSSQGRRKKKMSVKGGCYYILPYTLR